LSLIAMTPADVPPALPPADHAAIEVHYGGPDKRPGVLRDLLKTKIDAAPPGSEILWTTYYFRDLELAERLVAAHRRGVRVRVRLDGRPRRPDANDQVIARLRAGLGDGVRTDRSWWGIGRLHAKVYAFSGPWPEVLIGSFNPSGDPQSDSDVTAAIGDQDRGENLLVSFRDPPAVAALGRQAERLWAGKGSRFGLAQNRAVDLKSVRLYYFPRLRPGVVDRRVARLRRGDRVQAAISHMDDGPFARALRRAARRGVEVDLVVHNSVRRVPDEVVEGLGGAGARVRRYCTAEGLPMHAKFLLVTRDGVRSAWFGSFNYNTASRLRNKEILAWSSDPRLVNDLETRFVAISAAIPSDVAVCR